MFVSVGVVRFVSKVGCLLYRFPLRSGCHGQGPWPRQLTHMYVAASVVDAHPLPPHSRHSAMWCAGGFYVQCLSCCRKSLFARLFTAGALRLTCRTLSQLDAGAETPCLYSLFGCGASWFVVVVRVLCCARRAHVPPVPVMRFGGY